MSLQTTSSQTVGPYFNIGLRWLNRDNIAGEGAAGDRVAIEGRVIDADGIGVADALVEIWQANAHGKYAHPDDTQDKPLEAGFRGFGRIPTDKNGAFRFTTIKPGSVPGPNGKPQAPHLVVSVFMRGLLKRLVTRMYFPEESLNSADPILNLVAAERRATLIAKKVPGILGGLQWNIYLHGADETVFFDVGL